MTELINTNELSDLDTIMAAPLRTAGVPSDIIDAIMKNTGCYNVAYRMEQGKTALVQLNATDLTGRTKRAAWVLDGAEHVPTGFSNLDNVYEIDLSAINRDSTLIANVWHL